MLNLTQHKATPEQIEAGVEDCPEEYRDSLVELLTFDTLPDTREIQGRARDLAQLAMSWSADDDYPYSGLDVMIGGAPFFMSALEAELLDLHMTPHYAFSRRESVEETQDDGSVVKRNVFKHIGFVCAKTP